MIQKLSHSWSSDESDGDVFGISVSSNSSLIGCALSTGRILLHSARTGRLSYELEHGIDEFPVTTIKFHPSSEFFISASVDGSIKCWSSRNTKVKWTMNEKSNDQKKFNQIFASAFNPDGSKFCTAGLDAKIRIYDFETRQNLQVLEKNQSFEDGQNSGHTSRILSTIYKPDDPNVLFSSGWDDTIYMWDLRAGRSIRSLFGPHVCSDALDVHDVKLVAGSWRTNDQLQMWDLRTFTNDIKFKWSGEPQCLVYAAKFHPNGHCLFAAGSGTNRIACFDVENGNQICSSEKLEFPIFSLGFLSKGDYIIAGESKGRIHSYKIVM